VVQSGGVAIATTVAATKPAMSVRILAAVMSPFPVSQQSPPKSIMERPRMFSTSTRSKSVAGDHGYPSAYSCTRKSNPSPYTSAPRNIVCFAIAPRSIPFSRIFSVTSATEIPARKMKSGAGSVPPSRDQAIKAEFRASGLSQES